jgi:hypothetical protein
MQSFLTAHLKQILTAGFVLGFLSLVIRILDSRLPQRHKEGFSRWIEDSAPKLGSTDLNAIFRWAQSHKILIASIFVAGNMAVEFYWFESDSVAILVLLPICLGLAGGLYTLSAPSLRRASIRSICVSACLLFLAALTVYLLMINRYGSDHLFDGTPSTVGLVLVIAVPTWFVANVLSFLVVPLLVILIFRPPLILLGRGMLWLSTYPKGAWDGLVFALTILFGALRLFI